MRTLRLVSTLGLVAASAALCASLRAADDAAVRVSLCDGQGTMAVPGLRPGQELARGEAEALAGQMMQVWRRGQGETRWAAWVAEDPAVSQADQPTKFTARDRMLWTREEKKWVDEGYRAFHSGKELGGTIGVSCDMCHPDASNTHPETYPKYQAQLKKVALLRDMVNWCIENPMKGRPLSEDDPRLRAVEAYILASRKGVALETGKH
jgi:hypothetical protein